MAYMSKERKAELAPWIMAVLKEYGEKGTLSISHYSTLVLKIKAGGMFEKGMYINEYHLPENFDGRRLEFLKKVKEAMMIGNHDNSDVMTDYFDVGWYITITIV